MKIKLLGKDLTQIRLLLSKYGLVEVDTGFDLIVAHGGDGTLLGAERDYPGVLKLPIRDKSCCPEHTPEQQIKKLVDGVLKEQHLQKVAARYQNTQLSALNDVFLHMSDPASALRYRVYIDDELYADEVVGDGVCFCSVHGSSAYYRSITHSIFRTGVGLAFSNSTEAVDHLVLDP